MKIVVWLGGYKNVFEPKDDEEYSFDVQENRILVIRKNGDVKTVYKEWSSVSVI